MAKFSVVLLTAPPPGLSSEAGGAYLKIDGREALLRSVELFLNRDNVVQIQLSVTSDHVEEARQKFGAHLGFSGVKLISTGPRWVDQIVAADATISTDATHVLIHDAARPAVPFSDIDALMDAADGVAVAALTAPVRTTLLEVDDGGSPVAYELPSRRFHLLTPQVYSRTRFAEWAAKKTEPHPSELKLIKGSALNVRLGSAADTPLVKAMIGMLPKPKAKGPSSPFDEAQW